MTSDLADERRSEKNTIFLQGLENYVTELAKSNHGAKPDVIVSIFKENFNRSMLANADYHSQMAELHENSGDKAMSELHKLQAEIYRTISAQ